MKNRELIFPISCIAFAVLLYQFELYPEGNIFVLIAGIRMTFLIYKTIQNAKN
tara:strand:- start:15351 stop:15509 length:159 start_codon:yes stop_codon:yes gene_type:complete